jgi:subtilisin family serine protease
MHLPRSFLLLLLLMVFSVSIPIGSCFAPGNAELPSLLIAPIVRATNRTRVLQGQFLVQCADRSRNEQVQLALPNLMASLTAASVITAGVLPFGVSVAPTIGFSYDSALIGFSLRLDVTAAAGLPPGLTLQRVYDLSLNALAQVDGVVLIEEDAEVSTIGMQSQETDLWHMDRVDQRGRNNDDRYYYNTTASNVHAYILDTGIRKSHSEFETRADWVFSAFDAKGASTVNAQDGHGHGTHVAGTVGSRSYGLAKAVRLHAVKVLDDKGAGSDSGVIAGLDWVAKNRILPAVGVMSLGGGISSSLDTAVKNCIKTGVVIVVAAGNSNSSACAVSPAHVDTAITVAASDPNDRRAWFSNWGACATLFAPGVGIVSVSHQDDSSSTTMSGTSMAAPHVGGAVALYLAQYPKSTPAQVKNDIICFSTKDGVSDTQGTPNRLLFTFTNQGGAAAESTPGATKPSTDGAASDSQPTGNNQFEQCTSASPCVGPVTATLTSTAPIASFVYNSTMGGFHRAWLQYNTGGGTILKPQNVQNSLFLHQWSDESQSWNVVASATDSNNAKNIMWQDSASTGSTFAWTIQAKGYTPSTITLTYKLPSAPVEQDDNNKPGADVCSATTTYDPNPEDPNNVGQDPNGRRNAAGDLAAASGFMQIITLLACLTLFIQA